MKKEMVDIVDEQNTVIGHTSKENAHRKGFLHRTVISEIIDSHGNFILVEQASGRQDAGQYVSPVGGHVSSRESEEDALKREALEEAGLKGFSYSLIGRAIFNRNIIGRQENHYFILFEIQSDESITLNHEAVSFKTFTPGELKQAIAETPEKFGAAYYFILETFYPNLLPDNYQNRF
jgi:isopentenyl-diphosphate delta-isomerase